MQEDWIAWSYVILHMLCLPMHVLPMVFPKHQYSLFDAQYGFANHNKLLLTVILFSLFFFIFQTKSISYFHLQNQII